MKINIELDNLQDIVEETAKHSVEKTMEKTIANVVTTYINNNFKETIEDEVSTAIEKSINNYLDNAEIKVGGGFTNEPEVIYTPKQYINKCIADYFEKQVLLKEQKVNSWSNEKVKEKISFEEYINDVLDWRYTVKKELDNFANQLKNQINANIKKQYDQSLRDALNQTVINSLMESKKFKELTDNIKELV